MSGVWSHSGVWSLESGIIPESGGWSLELLRRLESLQNLEAGVWRHSGDWSPQSQSGVWSLESLRSLEGGVWSYYGGWSLSRIWRLESGGTPEAGEFFLDLHRSLESV